MNLVHLDVRWLFTYCPSTMELFYTFVSYQEYLHVTVLNPHILCFSTSLEVNHTMKNCVVCKTGNLVSFILNSMFYLYQGNSFVSYIHWLWKFPAPSQVIEDIYPSWCIFWPGKSLPSLLGPPVPSSLQRYPGPAGAAVPARGQYRPMGCEGYHPNPFPACSLCPPTQLIGLSLHSITVNQIHCFN